MTEEARFDLDMSAVRVLHAATLAASPSGGIVVGDDATTGWHLVGIEDARFLDREIELTLTVEPIDATVSNLYFNLWGGLTLASITPSGVVLPGALADAVSVSFTGNGMIVTIRWTSAEARIVFGMSDARGTGFHAGRGAAHWAVHSASVVLRDTVTHDDERLIYVDVGAAGGIDGKWRPHLERMHCVFIEPDPVAAAKLARDIGKYPSAQVLPYGLSDRNGAQTLHITAFDQCSSLREPNTEVLARWEVAPLFEVVERIQVDCRRYEDIADAPVPDCLKIDVQGMEFEVLHGFGRYLDTVLGVELESQFYEMYKGQKFLCDIVVLMQAHGLWLRSISPQFNFGRDLAELNAFFTRDPAAPGVQARKLDLIHRVWDLQDRAWGASLTALVQARNHPA